MSGHTYTHTHIHTYTHTHTHDNYYNPRCAHAHRGLTIMELFEALKLIRIINIILYLRKTAQHEAHALIWKNN